MSYKVVNLKEKIEVPVELLYDIIGNWRAANEAPGGCSPREALDGMRDSVFEIDQLVRVHEVWVKE